MSNLLPIFSSAHPGSVSSVKCFSKFVNPCIPPLELHIFYFRRQERSIGISILHFYPHSRLEIFQCDTSVWVILHLLFKHVMSKERRESPATQPIFKRKPSKESQEHQEQRTQGIVFLFDVFSNMEIIIPESCWWHIVIIVEETS